jgi:hypothetical protein
VARLIIYLEILCRLVVTFPDQACRRYPVTWVISFLQRIRGIACGNEPSIFDAAGMISSSMRGPEQNLEFMAKKLLYRSESPKVLIGTPLYVAMAE